MPTKKTPEGLEIVNLAHPITTPTGEISKITLRRAKVKDMKAAQRHTGAAEQEIALISLLSIEKLTPEDLEELDLADYAELQRTFQKIVGSKNVDK